MLIIIFYIFSQRVYIFKSKTPVLRLNYVSTFLKLQNETVRVKLFNHAYTKENTTRTNKDAIRKVRNIIMVRWGYIVLFVNAKN